MEQEKTTQKTVWEVLSAVDCSQYVEKKDRLTYLSWAWAWGLTRRLYPTASYTVREWLYPDGMTRPYFYDPALGYLVETSVTIEGETISMRLPVMDSKNKAMKAEPYKYCVTYGGRTYEKSVDAATMFDINTAIMRCLTKNLAMFGLGHYIYAGEDIPRTDDPAAPAPAQLPSDYPQPSGQARSGAVRADAPMSGVEAEYEKLRGEVLTFLKNNEKAREYYCGQYAYGCIDEFTRDQTIAIYKELKANKRI